MLKNIKSMLNEKNMKSEKYGFYFKLCLTVMCLMMSRSVVCAAGVDALESGLAGAASETVLPTLEDDEDDADDAAFIGSEVIRLIKNASTSAALPPNIVPLFPETSSFATPLEGDSDADSRILPPTAASGLPPEVALSKSLSHWPFEKFDGIEPVLVKDAEIKPDSGLQEKEEEVEITGRLLIEEQPVTRKKAFRRWVLETENGDRIPLTSNYVLISAVKNSDLLDCKVKATGKWTVSALEPRLKFFTADRFDSLGSFTPELSDVSSKTELLSPASQPAELASSSAQPTN